MNKELKIEKSIKIKAPIEKIWAALTKPEIVKQYMFDTELATSWQVGESITFSGNYNGQDYLDKGKVTKFEPEKELEYTYLSSFSGLEDKEDNYSLVSYKLKEEEGETTLSLCQQGFANEEAQKHSEAGWQGVLESIKKLVETE